MKTWELIIGFGIVFLLFGTIILGFIWTENRIDSFCKSQGYKHEFGEEACYKTINNEIEIREVIYLDGGYHFVK